MELAVRRDDTAACAKRKSRQPTRHQFVRVLSERDVVGVVAQQARKAGAHTRRPLGRALPLVVDELRRIEPRALLCLEGDVRPRLMRMSGEQHRSVTRNRE
jgi:hypothetical protein